MEGFKGNSIVQKKEQTDTLMFYREKLRFEVPSLVLLDASIFFYLDRSGQTLEHIRDVIKDPATLFCTTPCVLQELNLASTMYSSSGHPLGQAIQLATSVELKKCAHKGIISVEKCIRCFLGIQNSENMFLATMLYGRCPLVGENPLIPIISEESGRGLVLKERSISDRQLAKQWRQTFSIRPPTFTDEELSDEELSNSPNYQILLKRVTSLGFTGKITVNDSENQFKAISQQLSISYKAVKRSVVNQLLLHPERYDDRNRRCYLSYLVGLSRDGQWGDLVTLQAACDSFEVKIVVINSCKEAVYVVQYNPYGVEHPKKAIYLSCLLLEDKLYYNSLQQVPTDSFHGTCDRDYRAKKRRPGRMR